MNMNLNSKLIALAAGTLSVALTAACDNDDIDFPDYGVVSVYFPYQTPVRTLVLGSDVVETDLDKQYKCRISATMGGAYGGRDIEVDFVVDESLLTNVRNEAGEPLTAMPADYYRLSGNRLSFGGQQTGSVEVQLTDAFFADPKSVESTYIIPIRMTGQVGADTILSGSFDPEAFDTAPARLDGDSWKVKPMDYVLYCVKYKCKYDAYFSRCGKYTVGGTTVQIPDEAKWEGHFDPVVDGDDCNTRTVSLNQVLYSVSKTVEGVEMNCELLLTFDEQGACTLTSKTEGISVSGSGKFTPEGAKKAWGDKDRDLLELNFTLSDGTASMTCAESLVWKRSGVLPVEEFKTKYVAE